MPNFQDLLNYVGNNLKHSADLQKATGKQMMDRISMENHPEFAGPRLPDQTDQEKEYYGSIANGMMGSVAPIAKLAAPVIGAVEEAAPTMLQMAKETAKKARDMDFAKRLADQTKNIKFDKLKQYLGQ